MSTPVKPKATTPVTSPDLTDGIPTAPTSHDCSNTGSQPPEPTASYYKEHHNRGAEPCEWAMDCLSFAWWVKKHPNQPVNEWPGRVPMEDRTDPNRPYVPHLR